jgi:hypothetical protein
MDQLDWWTVHSHRIWGSYQTQMERWEGGSVHAFNEL